MKKQNEKPNACQVFFPDNYKYVLTGGINNDMKICDRLYADDVVTAYLKVNKILNNINSIILKHDNIVTTSNEDEIFKLESLTRI